MKLSEHIDKGFWAVAVQALVALYGFVFMYFVVRVLPEKEFGNYVLIQSAFLILSHLGSALAFGPMVKYFHDYLDRKVLLTNVLLIGVIYFLLSGLLIWTLRALLGTLFNSPEFSKLAFFVPLLLAVSIGRFFSHQLLRTLYRIKEIFLTHLVYHVSALVLILALTMSGKLTSAYEMLMILVIAFGLQSLIGCWLVRDQLSLSRRLDYGCLKTLFNYGKYLFGSSANSQIYERVDVFMIAAIVGPLEVALYNSAKLFMRIIDMYRQVVALLAFPTFSKLSSENRKKDIKAVYEKSILFSLVLLIPVSLILIIFAKQFFHFFYAGKYIDGVFLLQLFAITGPFFAWHTVGEGLLNGLGFPKISFGARTATTITKVVLNLVLIYLLQARGAVAASIIAIAVLAIVITRGVKSKVDFSITGILSRFKDIKNFLKVAKLQLKSTSS